MSPTTPSKPDDLSIPVHFVDPEAAWKVLQAAHLTLELEAIDPNSRYCSGICNMDTGICEGHPTGKKTALTGLEALLDEPPLYLEGNHAEARAELLAMLPHLVYTLRAMGRENQQLKDALRGEPTVGDPNP